MYTFAFLDLEMTGLDVQNDCILEIAVVLTDSKLEKVLEGPSRIIHQTDEVLENMNDWCKDHHGQSGLIKAVQESHWNVSEVEDELYDFLNTHMEKGKAIICGNSIHTDRKFLHQYMPKVDGFFHYRMLDVSVLKIITEHWYDDFPRLDKKNNHRAVDDIYESIEELKHYRRFLFK